jgi:hypothetical protein
VPTLRVSIVPLAPGASEGGEHGRETESAAGQFPAIPRDNKDLAGSTPTTPSTHLQAIANTAGFHFAMIEQGGSSLYPSLAQRVTDQEVLRVRLIWSTDGEHLYRDG